MSSTVIRTHGKMEVAPPPLDPKQYLMVRQGLMPDEDTMMKIAIALSLQEEVRAMFIFPNRTCLL